MISDEKLVRFTEDWWRSFMVYEAEEGRAYVSHVFNHVHKQHFVDFLRDAFAELQDEDN